jgi:hypothetical protein
MEGDDDNPIVRMEYTFADGTRRVAEGEAAKKCFRATFDAFRIALVHGFRYDGPYMVRVDAPQVAESATSEGP